MVVPKSFSISRAEDFFLSNIVCNVRLGFETDTMEGLVRIEGIAGMGMEVRVSQTIGINVQTGKLLLATSFSG